MSGPFGSSQWMYKSGDYEIDNSLRFEDGSSAYLSRTPEAGNRKTWTFSTWIKRGNLGIDIDLLHAYADSGERSQLVFAADDTIKFDFDDYTANRITTTQVFRDVSAWYHIVLAVDTTQGTAANRVKIYVNGNQITNFSAASYPSEDEEGHINTAIQHEISSYDGSGSYHDGYLAEVNFIEGAQKVPADFGETGDYGEWKPKKYGGAYGNEGFYLDFKSSGVGTASSSTVGADRSGNDNHWTSNNLTATDQMIDTPTNNFCTMNTLSPNRSGLTFSEGNLKMAGADTGFFGTMGVSSGKWYYEMHSTNAGGNNLNTSAVGIVHEDALHDTVDSSSNDGFQLFGGVNKARGYYGYAGNKLDEDSNDSYGAAFVTGDVIGVALNLDDREITFYKNNASQGVAFTSLGSGEWFPLWQNWTSSVGVMNFGQDSSFAGVKTAQGNQDGNDIGDFYYAPPSGFLALCTKNFPEPAVIPSEYFNTILYTGDDQTGKSITGVGFQPTFSWIKEMQGAAHHVLHDAARGATAGRISSNRTAVEDATDSMASFNSDGFVVGSSAAYINSNNASIVAWNWKGGGAGSSNTEGSINTTKTSADTDAGFSIMTYTGNATEGATIGHGLTKAPEVVMTKKRAAAAGGWMVFHIGNTAAPETDELNLEVTEATQDSANIWNDTLPSNTVISLGNNSVINADGATFVAYAWHSVEGFSKFGAYGGNNNADGTFVHLGFKPALVITKAASRTGHWNMQDNKNNPFNVVNKVIFANDSAAQYTDPNAACLIDFTSNGFKWRNNDDNNNDTGETYVYMAWAETPFKYANAR
jgi:hypothetical protein